MSPIHNKRSTRLILSIIFVVALCLSAIFQARRLAHHTRSDADALNILREAYAAVLENYVDKPDSKKLVLTMVDGMLAALDPHSAYLPPEPYHEMEVQMSGSFGGIGIELGTREGKLIVITPIDDTPASRAGIQANDHIWKIDGTSTNGMNITAAVKRMRGEKGTRVSLTIVRSENSRPLVFNLVRDTIKIKSLKSRLLESGYGYIRISQFQERTGAEFKEALHELHAKSDDGTLKGLILDLRYNPGGLINSCVAVVNCFIGDDIKNSAIVSTRGRTHDSNHVYNATVGPKEPKYPVVILINGGSASASEIVAGAMQDHKRAIIMGTRSFGKGSVQSIYPMKGNAALKLTTALYYTPKGRSIQAKGITPDVEVPNITPLPPKEKKEFKEKDLENSLAADDKQEERQTRVRVPPHGAGAIDADLRKDFQLGRALELLHSLSMLKEKGYQ